MAVVAVPWSEIADFIEGAYQAAGRVERQDALDLAEMTNISDDALDAIDAIGSRIFDNPEDTKNFLVSRGYVKS